MKFKIAALSIGLLVAIPAWAKIQTCAERISYIEIQMRYAGKYHNQAEIDDLQRVIDQIRRECTDDSLPQRPAQ